MFFGIILTTCIFISVEVNSQGGNNCMRQGIPGRCVNIRECSSALIDIKNRKNPQICWFDDTDPIICCTDNVASSVPVATTSTQSPQSEAEYVPPFYDYVTNEHPVEECEALSDSLTANKTGRKAWDKCIEYQAKLVYPCRRGVALSGEPARANLCGHDASQLVVGGVDAEKGEFPHMALLGFGRDVNSAQWLCGGTIISEKFILTAGHCTFSRDFGAVTYAMLGLHKRTEKEPNKTYKIKTIIKHPEYKPPVRYNDIALLETETEMLLDQYSVPACLDVEETLSQDRALATGWGATEYRGSAVDTLQKVILTKFSPEECSTKFPPQRLMIRGLDNTQLCYGDKTMSKDTCQGDSGGPLQVKSKRINCMYIVIGVTSFGKACGYIGQPGVYTRVRPYVPWIESVVWP